MPQQDHSIKPGTDSDLCQKLRKELNRLHYEQYMLSIGLPLDSNDLKVPLCALGERLDKKFYTLKEKLDALLGNANPTLTGSQK